MGLIRYSCGLISGPQEPIPTKFGLRVFHHALSIHGIQNADMQEKKNLTSSIRYSVEIWKYLIQSVQSEVCSNISAILGLLCKHFLFRIKKKINCAWDQSIGILNELMRISSLNIRIYQKIHCQGNLNKKINI